MSESTPFLSVVIPTYNRCQSLRVTLDALARQHPVPGGMEVIVVSDGSTDGTTTLLAEWEARRLDFTFRSASLTNGGPARARNHGVGLACGTVVVFIDDDVEPQPSCMAAHAARHTTDDRLVLIGPMSPDPDRATMEPVWIAWEHAMLQRQYESWDTGLWADNAGGPHNFYTGNASVRREYVLAVGGFDEGFTRQEDVELASRMERSCGVHFRFDGNLHAFHRPSRTFESWLNTPYAYGRLDVVRVGRGNAQHDVIKRGYTARHVATRTLIDLALPSAPRGRMIRGMIRRTAEALFAIPQGTARRAALSAMSALYNLRYLEGARDELGSWRELRAFLAENTRRPDVVGTLADRDAA